MNDRAASSVHGIRARFSNPVHRIPEKRERPVAVMFADLEGCTRLCEELPPREMNRLIEKYFSHFFDAIEGVGGTVNEIMGDGFMALFDHANIRTGVRAAATAALAMQGQASALNAQRAGELDPVRVNIGIHAGIALVGVTKFGTSTAARWTYTASGPVSNIAARLCGLAVGGTILVSADVAEYLDGPDFAIEPLGPQTLKNVSRPVLSVRLRGRTA